jgi:hypothetical protein
MGIHFAPFRTADVVARIVIMAFFLGIQALMIFKFFINLSKLSSGKIYLYIFLPFWTIISILRFWSYIVTTWLDAGSVKAALYDLGFKDLSIFQQIDSEINIQQIPEFLRSIPRCPKCNLPKPERTHHCSNCGLCYFRFDHHCQFIGNCIALNNMKAFMLFLFYASGTLILVAINFIAVSIMTEIMNIEVGIFYCVISLILGIALFAFGYGYVPRVCINITTLEQIGGIDPVTYDKGRKENFQQIFGRNCLFWFFPTTPELSGFTWAGYNCYCYSQDDQTYILQEATIDSVNKT